MGEMKKVLIIINICKDESVALAEEISDYLKSRDMEIVFYGFNGFCNKAPFDGYDFVITLGGDGTVLFAARNCVDYNIPLFPINLGEFGFIASIQPDEWKNSLDLFLDSKLPVTTRSMFDIEVIRNNNTVYSFYALNDAVISAQRAATIVSLDVNYNNLHLCKLKSDGLIVSTPTGSTAYSAAAGGPIIDPGMDAFVLTPLNSFSLSSRPIVLSPEGVLSIEIEKERTKNICLKVDGQEPVDLLFGDKVIIKQLKNKVKLVGCTEEKFYNALRSKLNWSGGPHA